MSRADLDERAAQLRTRGGSCVGLMWALPSLYRSAYSRRFARLAQIGARRVSEGSNSSPEGAEPAPPAVSCPVVIVRQEARTAAADGGVGAALAAARYRLGLGSVLSRTVREQPVLSQARMTTQ